MYRGDHLYSRSIMPVPFSRVEPIATFPHRRIEPPVPTSGRNFWAEMSSQRANLQAASKPAGSFYSSQTHALQAIASRPTTSASSGSLLSRCGLPTALPIEPSLATSRVRAHLAADDRNALSYQGRGYNETTRLDHLHRSPGSSDSRSSIAFAPLGYPRGVMKLSEPSPQLRQPRPATGAGPSIFGSVVSRGSSRGGF